MTTAIWRSTTIQPSGRKNFLFAGSDARGKRATLIYSLIDTAILSGPSPETYLADVLARIVGSRQSASTNSRPGSGSRL